MPRVANEGQGAAVRGKRRVRVPGVPQPLRRFGRRSEPALFTIFRRNQEKPGVRRSVGHYELAVRSPG